MPTYATPGVYVEEKKAGVQPIEGVSTSVAAFIGVTARGPISKATLVTSMAEFVQIFGGAIPIIVGSQERYVYYAVRHFFQEGGTTCYVVRTVGYTDVNDASSVNAVSAFNDFAGFQLDGTTSVPGALHVAAINEGLWGQSMDVQVESASRFSLLLAESVTVGANTTITLKENSDVVVGSVLYLVEQVTGVVKSVDIAGKAITFRPGLTAEAGPTLSASILDNVAVFSPDMKFMSAANVSATVAVTSTTDSAAIGLDSVNRISGAPLRAGDLLNFSRGASAMVVVTKVSEKVLPGPETAMMVEFASATLPAFDLTHTRVYARDFDLVVRDRASAALLETHTHLSLINENRRDYVNDRLAVGSGASKLIRANEAAGTAAIVAQDTQFTALGGGNDGLSTFGDDDLIGSPVTGTGLFALDAVTDVSLLVIPSSPIAVTQAAIAYCEDRRDLFFIMDLPGASLDPAAYVANLSSSYAAIYYPWIYDDDPATGKPVLLPPSGAVAGSYAQTDTTRGVHKAPAGVDNGYLNSATAIQRIVTKAETDILYQKRVNVIRKFPEGILIWGTRTLSAEPAWRYVNVRRLFIFLERSIERGLQWVVFEPNDYGLWKSVKRNVSAFLRVQWEEGKLVGTTEERAFFVRCDEITNPRDTVDVGQVIAEIGVAPSKPAEFVVFRFKQFAGSAK